MNRINKYFTVAFSIALVSFMTTAQADIEITPKAGEGVVITNIDEQGDFEVPVCYSDGTNDTLGKLGNCGELPIGATGPQGETGPAGPAGAVGPAGADGADGADGTDGATGPTGAVGPAGETGPVGPAGADGADGTDGATGPAGDDGVAGPAGVDGVAGPAGVDGAIGPIGPVGPVGADGPRGVIGPIGATGPAGANGATGNTGPKGDTGPAGANGVSGWERITGITSDRTSSKRTVTASCPAGKVAVGGGFSTSNVGSDDSIIVINNLASSPSTWTVTLTARTFLSLDPAFRATAHVICINN